MDFEGPFSCANVTLDVVRFIHEQLSRFEGMKWQEVENRFNHAIHVSRLSSAAQARLSVINMDDLEEVFSLRLQGKPRVIGIRRHAVLSILWYDPNHEVCPSKGADN